MGYGKCVQIQTEQLSLICVSLFLMVWSLTSVLNMPKPSGVDVQHFAFIFNREKKPHIGYVCHRRVQQNGLHIFDKDCSSWIWRCSLRLVLVWKVADICAQSNCNQITPLPPMLLMRVCWLARIVYGTVCFPFTDPGLRLISWVFFFFLSEWVITLNGQLEDREEQLAEFDKSAVIRD